MNATIIFYIPINYLQDNVHFTLQSMPPQPTTFALGLMPASETIRLLKMSLYRVGNHHFVSASIADYISQTSLSGISIPQMIHLMDLLGSTRSFKLWAIMLSFCMRLSDDIVSRMNLRDQDRFWRGMLSQCTKARANSRYAEGLDVLFAQARLHYDNKTR